METGAYLERIGHAGGTPPTDATLSRLQEAHLLSVPFENLDIGLGVPIVLDIRRLYGKIVVRRRGGFCYELNGLFHRLLTGLGFSATMVSARVYDAAKRSFGPPFDHMAILVDAGSRRWLADVGFGDFSMHPLRVGTAEPQEDPAGRFVLEEAPDGTTTVSRWSEEESAFVPQYDFTPAPRRLEDFIDMCAYQQSSPDSHFTQKRVCTIATPGGGRITLSGDRMIVTSGGRRTESQVAGEEGFRAALKEHFGVVMEPVPVTPPAGIPPPPSSRTPSRS